MIEDAVVDADGVPVPVNWLVLGKPGVDTVAPGVNIFVLGKALGKAELDAGVCAGVGALGTLGAPKTLGECPGVIGLGLGLVAEPDAIFAVVGVTGVLEGDITCTGGTNAVGDGV